MPIYIASNYESLPIGIVVSKSKDLANAFWHGQGVIPHSVREITLEDLKGHPSGVIPVLTTKVVSGYEISRFNKDKEYTLVSKK